MTAATVVPGTVFFWRGPGCRRSLAACFAVPGLLIFPWLGVCPGHVAACAPLACRCRPAAVRGGCTGSAGAARSSWETPYPASASVGSVAKRRPSCCTTFCWWVHAWLW
eukprot:3955772-Amphidinium_carterae.3